MGSLKPNLYWADGAGSQVIYDALQELLAELRDVVHSDRALALYRTHAMSLKGYFVLSDSCKADIEPSLGNERLLLNQALDLDLPSTAAGLVATSTLRPYRLGLTAALVLPWTDPFGSGAVVIGLHDHRLAETAMEKLNDVAHEQRLLDLLRDSRAAQTLGLQREVSGALRDVLAVDRSSGSAVDRLGSLVRTARTLTHSDAAYLALPESPSGTRFFFASQANIHTPPFRSLRMEFGQGLGGLARTTGRVVSSVNYAADNRLEAAPVAETGSEGIVSGMAAPLQRDDSVCGVLYVASRTPRPYSPTDELVLGEFAEYIGLLMAQPDFMSATDAVHADRMREDFAHAIHDSVVRSLVQIGFTAEKAARTASADAFSIDVIRKAAAQALANLREELRGLVAETTGATFELAEVLTRIVEVPRSTDVSRDVVFIGAAGEEVLDAEVAETLIQVGAEAIVNSDRHARPRTQTVEAELSAAEVVVRIVDDGRGSPILGLSPQQLTSMGHLGVASMHRRVEAIHGELEIESSVEGGTTITVRVPRRSGEK